MKSLKVKQIDGDLSSPPKEDYVKDPNSYSLEDELPSKLLFYDTSIQFVKVSPLVVKDVYKIHYASITNDLRTIAYVINNHLSGDAKNCYGLTTKDVDYIMFWLRENSFFKHNITKEFICTSIEHREKVVNEELDASTLYQESIIRKTDVDVKPLDPKAIEIFERVKKDYSVELSPEMYHSTVSYDELYSKLVPKNDKGEYDFSLMSHEVRQQLYVLGQAKFLGEAHGIDLVKRAEFLENLDVRPDFLFDLDEFIEIVSDYGVTEQVQVTCKECGHTMAIDLAIDARSFFP